MNRITELANTQTALNMLMSACIYLGRQMDNARMRWDIEAEITTGRAIDILRQAEAKVCIDKVKAR